MVSFLIRSQISNPAHPASIVLQHAICSFVLKTPERSYFLRAESKGDMKRWVRGLQEQQSLWRNKLDKSAADPARKPKHYSDIPRGSLVPQGSSGSLLASK